MSEERKNAALVSILCLTYNHEKYIKQALEGFVKQQTTYRFEVVIHDDASTDGTAKIIKYYEKKYPHLIKAIYQRNNLYRQGINCMKLCLEKYCHGKYIAFCEGDDYWIDINKLETQIDFMERHPECTMTYHPVNYISDGKVVGNDVNWDDLREVSVDEIIHGGGLFCASPSLVFKRSVGVEYPKFRIMADIGDYPLQILAALRGRVFYLPQLMGCYRRNHTGSWSMTIDKVLEKAIMHWKTEIVWLNELNIETDGRYYNSIIYRIAYCQAELYGLNYIQRNDFEKIINLINDEKDKKDLTSMLRRKALKRSFPYLFKFYKKLKSY